MQPSELPNLPLQIRKPTLKDFFMLYLWTAFVYFIAFILMNFTNHMSSQDILESLGVIFAISVPIYIGYLYMKKISITFALDKIVYKDRFHDLQEIPYASITHLGYLGGGNWSRGSTIELKTKDREIYGLDVTFCSKKQIKQMLNLIVAKSPSCDVGNGAQIIRNGKRNIIAFFFGFNDPGFTLKDSAEQIQR